MNMLNCICHWDVCMCIALQTEMQYNSFQQFTFWVMTLQSHNYINYTVWHFLQTIVFDWLKSDGETSVSWHRCYLIVNECINKNILGLYFPFSSCWQLHRIHPNHDVLLYLEILSEFRVYKYDVYHISMMHGCADTQT